MRPADGVKKPAADDAGRAPDAEREAEKVF